MNANDILRGRWPEIFRSYGLPQVTRLRHIDCPICGKKKKFRIDDKDGMGTWICVCGAGDGFKLLMETQGKDFKTLVNEIYGFLGIDNDYVKAEPVVNHRLIDAINRFKHSKRVEGTEAETYLNGRNIFTMPQGGIKFVYSLYNSDTTTEFSGLYAIASNEFGEAVYSHTTYLSGGKKALVPKPKKMLTLQEYSGSVAVKLFAAKSTLGIAEGIETALSCHQKYKLPVWSALNATLLKKFRAPKGVTNLHIFADNDSNGTGLAAALVCGNANLLCKNDVNKVSVFYPECGDFNDLIDKPGKVAEIKLFN